MSNSFYHWEIDELSGFRKLVLHIKTDIEFEKNKFINWTGEYKICSKCKESLPASTYFFYSGGKDGLHRYCKKCEGADKYGWGRKINKELNKRGKHYCSKCDRILDLNPIYFQKTNGRCNKTGYASNCKECTEESGFGIYRINSCDEIDIKDGYKICSKCFIEYPDNPKYFFNRVDRENGSTICKKCRGFKKGIQRLNRVLKNFIPNGYKYCNPCGRLLKEEEITSNGMCKECAKSRRREYNSRPEVKERKRMFTQKRRALKKKLKNDLTKEQYNETLLFFNFSCAYCGMTEEENQKIHGCCLHQDHIVPISKGGGYTKKNIVPACASCNKSKGNKSLDEFYEFSDSFTEERYNKIKEFLLL